MATEETTSTKRTIELRSEKVRSVVGAVPPALVRYGATVVAATLLILLLVLSIIPYRRAIPCNVVVGERQALAIDAPVVLAEGQSAHLLLQLDTVTLEGDVLSCLPHRDAQGFYQIASRFPASGRLQPYVGTMLEGRVVVSGGSMLRHILRAVANATRRQGAKF